MNTLLGLATRMEKMANEIEFKLSDVAVHVALYIVGDLAYKTPVDTSNALSNWQVTLSTPASSEISPYYAGSEGSTQLASASETFDVAYNVLASKKPGEAIYISNLADYINKLNEGSSAQRPAGFVERATAVGRLQINRTSLGL